MTTKQNDTMVMSDAQLETITGGIMRKRPGQREEPRRVAELWEIEYWGAGPHHPR